MGLYDTPAGTFMTGDHQHIAILISLVLFSIISFWWARKNWDRKQQFLYIRVVAWFISLAVVLITTSYVLRGHFDVRQDLPLVVCNLLAILLPLVVAQKKRVWYGVFYFIALGFTFQANITPDLDYGFPSIYFLKFWIAHTGILYVLFYALIVLRYRPYFKDIFRAVGLMAIYSVLVYGINLLLDSNYFFLLHKPKNPSLLDHLGPWPTYIFVGIGAIIPYFMLLYLPYFIKDRFLKRKAMLQ